MDHHVPLAISRGLRSRGIDVLSAQDDGSQDWEDDRILARATELGRAVFSQDDDFLSIARDWQLQHREFAGLIYAHQMSITIGQAVRDLALISQVLDAPEIYNQVEFLPL